MVFFKNSSSLLHFSVYLDIIKGNWLENMVLDNLFLISFALNFATFTLKRNYAHFSGHLNNDK